MMMHLGNDCFVSREDILMILDYKEAENNPDTAKFLRGIKRIVKCGGSKSAVIAEEGGRKTIYLSPVSSKTLWKRKGSEKWAAGENVFKTVK